MIAASRLAEPLKIGGVILRNRVFLAPMSGVSDLPMRELAWKHGAGLVVAEMVPGGELVKGRSESIRRIRKASPSPHMVQLSGRDPALLAEGARLAEAEGADIIDLNMGCPAKKVTGGYCGSALMLDPELAMRILDAVAAAVTVPVTVKMRLGWDDDSRNAPHLAQMAENAGAAMVTVHGRTRCQFYEGRADWTAIAKVRQTVSIPVVANGDVGDIEDAAEIVAASGADAVMIGRAHYGAPWTAGTVAAAFGARNGFDGAPAELGEYVQAHYEAMLSHYGRERGLRHARKHLRWYAERHAAASCEKARAAMMLSTEPAEVIAAIKAVFDKARSASASRRAA